jgi:short-subunit dehydrogenase
MRGMSDGKAPLALVTGASSGIGWHVAMKLAKRGHRTLLVARRADRLETLAASLRPHAPAEAVPLDLADPAAVPARIAELTERHGPVDVLVNNAGHGGYRPFLEDPEHEQRRMMETHCFAALSLIRGVLPGMLERERGHVINVASIAAKMGPWGHSSYAAAKAALIALTQSLATEYEEAGVHFSYVNPGIVGTAFFEEPSYGEQAERLLARAVPPELVARRIVKLLDRPRLELCVPRWYRFLDLVTAVSPRLAQRLVRLGSRPAADLARAEVASKSAEG